MVHRRILAALASAAVLAAPAPALAQSAGDDQYQDPFGGNSGGSGGGSGGSGSQAPSTPSTPAPAPSTPVPAASPAATTAQATAADPGRELPYTGSPVDALLLAAAGGTLLASGLTLRVRLRDRDGA